MSKWEFRLCSLKSNLQFRTDEQIGVYDSSLQQINQDLNIQLLKDGYRLDEIPDDEDLDLIPPKSVNPTCMCCQATSSTTCQIQ